MTDASLVDTSQETQEQEGVVLKDGVAIDPNNPPSKDGQEVEVEDRPEWLPERFKSPEELAKSYSELEKVLKEKGKIAPDEYTIDDAEKVSVDLESEVFKGFQEVAKKAGFNNAQFNEVLKFAQESGFLDVPDYEKEKAALGAEADTIIGSLTNFAQSRLNEKERQVLEGMALTADQTKLLYKLVRMNDKSVPARPGENAIEGKAEVEKKLQILLNDPGIRNDMVKKQEAERLATVLASMR